MKTKYKMQVFEVFNGFKGYQQLTATKRFNTFSLAKCYMTALRAKYDGDKFVCEIYTVQP